MSDPEADAGAQGERAPDHARAAQLVLAGSVALLLGILVAAVLSIASAPGPGATGRARTSYGTLARARARRPPRAQRTPSANGWTTC